MSKRPNLGESATYHRRALAAIAGGVNSNVRLNSAPLYIARAQGAHLFDVDGNSYIDYALGMGPTVLGHAPAAVIEAVSSSLAHGQLYAAQHPAEVQLAELVRQLLPSAELVRFGVTGSEMVQAAIRLARAYTGRNKIVKFEGHYHGWFDSVLANVSGSPGDPASIPLPIHLQTRGQPASCVAELLVLPWNSVEALKECFRMHGRGIAAVLMEPMMCNSGAILPLPGYLQAAREICEEHGALLIFDEVVTGFRLALGGAQGLFAVEPHLAVFAKALGAGFPLSMLTGRSAIMELFANGSVNHSGTYNANVVGVVAGVAALQALAADDGSVYRHIDHIGRGLMTGLRELGAKHSVNLSVTGVGAVFNTSFTDEQSVVNYASFARSLAAPLKTFLEGLVEQGIRPTSRGTWFVSAAHSEIDVETTLAAADLVLASMQERGNRYLPLGTSAPPPATRS